jgi:alkylhydroperoxidase family enzyme
MFGGRSPHLSSLSPPDLLQDTEWEECLIEPRKDTELEREARRVYGVVPPATPFLAPCPWLARALGRSHYRNGLLAHIPLDLGDLVFLAVSQENSCRYCYAAQRASFRIQGFDEKRIRNVEEASFSAESDRREQLALDFARRIARSNPAPTAADREALREAGYDDQELKEIAYVAAYTVWGNQGTTLPAVPVDGVEGVADRWLTRMLRPVLAKVLRSRWSRGRPERLAPQLRTGPFAYVALELDGLPAARTWQENLGSAWSSPLLSPRAKALVFAVVARGLGSRRAEEEAKRLLAPEGLGPGEVEEILAHLASPKLDRVEAAIVPFARQTIRYRPADIQRRARRLLDELSTEQFLELVGVAGLANATVRLSLALCES